MFQWPNISFYQGDLSVQAIFFVKYIICSVAIIATINHLSTQVLFLHYTRKKHCIAKWVPGALNCQITVYYECSILGGQADSKRMDIFLLKTFENSQSATHMPKSPHILS